MLKGLGASPLDVEHGSKAKPFFLKDVRLHELRGAWEMPADRRPDRRADIAKALVVWRGGDALNVCLGGPSIDQAVEDTKLTSHALLASQEEQAESIN